MWLVAGCTLVVAAATASAGTVFNQTTPYLNTSYSMCTNEDVLVQGRMQMLIRSETSGDRQHFGADVHLTGLKGTGVISGDQYVESDVQNTQQNITFSGPQEFTAEQTTNLTHLGETQVLGIGGDDFRYHLIVHVTLNANGVPTAQKDDSRVECR